MSTLIFLEASKIFVKNLIKYQKRYILKDYFSFDTYWQIDKSEVKDELIQFWVNNAVLKKEVAEKRVDEVVILCRNKEQRLIGVATVFKSPIEQLRNDAYVFRCFISEKHRAPALDTQLVIKSFDILQQYVDANPDDKAVGLLIVVQNKLIKQNWNKAIWPDVGMVYIGNLPNGDHMRICYFNGVKV